MPMKVEKLENRLGYLIDGEYFKSLDAVAKGFNLTKNQLIHRLRVTNNSLEEALEVSIMSKEKYPIYYQGVLYPSIDSIEYILPISTSSLYRHIEDISKIKYQSIDAIVDKIIEVRDRHKLVVFGHNFNALYEVARYFNVNPSSLYAKSKSNKKIEECIEEIWNEECIEFEGQSYHSISELCSDYKIEYTIFMARIKILGMTFEQAVKQPIQVHKKTEINFRGHIYYSYRDLSNSNNLSASLTNRLRIGYNLKDRTTLVGAFLDFIEERKIETNNHFFTTLPFAYYDKQLFFKASDLWNYIGMPYEKFSAALKTPLRELNYTEIVEHLNVMTIIKDGIEQRKFPTLKYDKEKNLVFFVRDFRDYVRNIEEKQRRT